jgi:hypothetical protein
MKNRQYQAALLLHTALVANAPKDTWNLALNSIRIAQEHGQWYVLIGGEIAPYAEFTNEPWTRGKNPNEGWIERTIEECMPMIKQIMSGSITQAEIDEWKRNRFETDLIRQYDEHIARKVRELENI